MRRLLPALAILLVAPALAGTPLRAAAPAPAAWRAEALAQAAPEPLLPLLPAARPVVRAVALEPEEVIDVDGRLEEPAWDRATPATAFVQRDPVNGAPATERTEVRVLFDRHRLYIGVICYDANPAGILGNQMQRDASFVADDRFMWAIDTYLDGRTAYYFEINPSGAMGDGLITPTQGGTSVNRSWDGIWTARVRRSEAGWAAEIAIPFRTLNFDPHAAAWGINFQRTIRRKNEEVLWSGHGRPDRGALGADQRLLPGRRGVVDRRVRRWAAGPRPDR